MVIHMSYYGTWLKYLFIYVHRLYLSSLLGYTDAGLENKGEYLLLCAFDGRVPFHSH